MRIDCFRIYEAIIAGAIPVIVADQREIDATFNYMYKNIAPPHSMHIVTAANWMVAAERCKSLLADANGLQTLQAMQAANAEWWVSVVTTLRNLTGTADGQATDERSTDARSILLTLDKNGNGHVVNGGGGG